MTSRKAILLPALSLLAIQAVPAATVSKPEWMERIALTTPEYARKSPLAVLFEEEMFELDGKEGRKRIRGVVKVLTREGASGRLPLVASQRMGERFKLIGGWRVQPDGAVIRYDSRVVAQVATDDRLSFSMEKLHQLAPLDVRVGDIVAWECLLTTKPESTHLSWRFGGPLPTVESRFGVKLPQGWSIRSTLKNAPDIPPFKDEEGFTVWRLKDIKPIQDELFQPSLGELAPHLLATYEPPGGQISSFFFRTWQDVASWYGSIAWRQVAVDESIRQTAVQVSSQAATPEEKVAAIGRFVRGLRYLNVAVGRSVAEPHPAPDVLRNRFGDCEDKAILTIALLEAAGFKAYPVVALTSDAGSVDPNHPAPDQFNHVIVAIDIPPSGRLAATADLGAAGTLLFFDPTSTNTGFGDLPYYLQGTRGLLVHPKSPGLVTLPKLPASSASREATFEITFPPTGGVNVSTRIQFHGQYGAIQRGHEEGLRGEKRRKEWLDDLTSRYGRAEIRMIDARGIESSERPLELDLDVWIPVLGKETGSLRMMPTSFLVGSRAGLPTESERSTPFHVEASFREFESIQVALPDGWEARTSGDSIKAASLLGSYRKEWKLDERTITIERELIVEAGTTPPLQYAQVKRFFEEVARGDALAVVLEKRGSGQD